MTALEAYDLTTRGGGTDFERVIKGCEAIAPYCLIGGLAVNSYVEPVYTLDAEIVVSASALGELSARLPDTLESDLRIQFTTDERYQEFPACAVQAEILGLPVRVASLTDVARGKLWAYSDPRRRLSKRKKDELDLIRLGEAYPDLQSLYPDELRRQFEAE